MRLRSIRQKILLLVLVPVLSLIGLYAFATSLTARATINLARTNTLRDATGVPTGNFLGTVGQERMLAVVYLSRPVEPALAALEAAEAKTSATAAALRAALTSGDTLNNASPAEKHAIAVLLKDANGLPALRAQIRDQTISRPQAFTDYNQIIQDAYTVLNQVILQETNGKVLTQSLAFVRLGKSSELLGQEATLIVADLAAGSFPAADRQQFTALVGARRFSYAQSLADLVPPYSGYYAHDVSPAALAALTSLENRLTADGAVARPPAVSPTAWQQAVGAVVSGLSAAGTQASAQISKQASADARATDLTLILAGGLGLLAVVLSIVVSFRIGRSMVRELAQLRDSALELANNRLPSVVNRLAAGQEVDVAAEAPDLPAASSDEIGQVQQAFAAVQQTAVEAAVGQARLRQGISDIFRNLARRSQSLLHRQLTLLDAMERRAKEPEELEDLFRIDHLTTRMRRHAESLIILSGEAPARGWRRPVPFVDVLRAAVAEVEDYTRIKVTVTSRAALNGPAVADVIHLLAELAENAVIFSPPNTPVLITGDVVGRGFAVEIEDRGLGLSEERRAELNALLADPPPFDASGSDRLGLFVASRLARKHSIRVSLRASPYGGTTAIVLIPVNLVVPEDGYDEAAVSDRQRVVPLTGRHAARDDAVSFGTSSRAALAAEQPPAGRRVPGQSLADITAELWRSADTPDPWTVSSTPAEPAASAPGLPGLDLPGSGLPEPEPADAALAEAPPAGVWGADPAGDRTRPETPPGDEQPAGHGSVPAGLAGTAGSREGLTADSDGRGAGAIPAPRTAWTVASEPDSSAALAPGTSPAPGAGGNGNGSDEYHGNGYRGNGLPHGDSALAGCEDAASGDGTDELDEVASLPRRTRQASLAPQLRSAEYQPAPPGGTAPDGSGDRTPEQARSTVAAIQRGWERGRSLFEPAPHPIERMSAGQVTQPGGDQTGNGDEPDSDAE
jgi:signal transduction histidine kinase